MVGDHYRPGIVHRLDMDTSGCIVAAKNDSAHHNLQRQWRARKVVKEYLAIVHGTPRDEEGIIDRPLDYDKRTRKKMAVRYGGKASYTHYRVEEYYGWHSLVRVLPKTGRTHQIRVHMANIGHPILCDPYYGREVSVTEGELTQSGHAGGAPVLSRQALHAERLGFAHPASGTWMDFRAPLHEDMMKVVAILAAARPPGPPEEHP